MDQPLVNLYVPQPEQAMFRAASHALTTAQAYVIDSPDMRDLAATELITIKRLQKQVETKRTDITGPINQALKGVNDLFRPPADYLKQAETVLKGAIQTYDREQERQRIEAQAKLEAAARQERARLAAEAAAREAAAQAEANRLRCEAEQAAAQGQTEAAARLAADAQSRIEQGVTEVATLQQTATLITAPIVAAPPKTKGVSTRKVWKAHVTDKLALIRYVAAHPQYVEWLEVNMTAINRIALALKAQAAIDGVRVVEEESLAVRAA